MTARSAHPDKQVADYLGVKSRPVVGLPRSVMLVGAGRRGLGAHVPALTTISSLRLVAIVETPDRIAALRTIAAPPVPMHDSVAAGLAAVKPDLAIVATPHHSHVPLAIELLRAGIPTLIEKPPATTHPELLRLVRACQDYRTPVATVLPLRYTPQYQRFAEFLRCRQLTDAEINVEAHVPRFPGVGGWRRSLERAGGGVLIDLGYHYLELLVTSLGIPDHSSVQLSNEVPSQHDVEDQAEVSLWYEARRLRVNVSLRAGVALPKYCKILVTQNRSAVYKILDHSQSVPSFASREGAVRRRNATAAQLKALLDTGFLSGGGAWCETLDTQLNVMSVVDQLYAIAGRAADIPERVLI